MAVKFEGLAMKKVLDPQAIGLQKIAHVSDR